MVLLVYKIKRPNMNSQNFTITPDLYASKGSRFANYIIDLIINMVFIYAIIFLISVLLYSISEDQYAVDEFFYKMENINPFLDRLITGTFLALLYFITETMLKGKTIGKYITKTRVVLEDGTNPTALDYLKRSFSRIIPFEAFSFLGADARGWHDTISKTYVVDAIRFDKKKESHSELDQIGKEQE